MLKRSNSHDLFGTSLTGSAWVGPFGETQVIDWGLALVSDQACPSPGRAGTASAMSPEQARGEPIDSRTDVYALGAILREVATRRPLFPASMERRDIIAAVAQGAIPPLPEDGLATELRAVIQRAMHPDKLQRYPDAKSFADDLARYLDGRRVTAHAYTPRELLSRLWRAWKVPFILTVVALTIVVTTLTIAVAEVSSERDHSERTLGRSLVASARTALREDDRGQAEVLALAALDRGEFPEAMGVLAALPVERPTREIEALSGCEVADVADIGNIGESKYADNIGTTQSRRILCRGPKTLSVREGEKTLWTRELATQAAVFVGAGEGLVVQIDGTRVERLEARTGLPHAPAGAIENTCPYGSIQRAPGGQFALHHSSGCAVAIGLDSEQPIPLDLCDVPSIRAIALGTDGQSWALGCTDGGLVTGRFDHERGARFETAFAVAPERPLATAIAVIDDHSLLIGDSDGGLSLVELARPRDRRRLVPRSGLIREVHYEPTQGLALVHYESGAPYLIDVERRASRGRLPPRAEGGYLSVAFEADGRLRAGLHDRIERWDFSQVPVRALVFREGVSDLAVAPKGELVAIAHGANLSLLNLTERRVIRSQSWQSELVRTVAFDPFTPAQGPPELIAASFGERGARRLSLGRHLGFLPFELLIRRAVALSENRLLVSDFFRKLWVLAPDRAPTPGPPIDAQMHAMCDGRHLAILDPKAAIWFRRDWAPGLELEPVQERTQAIAIGCSDAERVFAVERSGVVELSTDMNAMGAHVMRYDAKDSDLVSGAVSQTALAAGARDGSVFLWKKGESRPIAIVRDHDRRVDRVAFHPSGRWLVAGDWDGRLLFIDALPQARALDSSGSAAAWGLDLDTLIPER